MDEEKKPKNAMNYEMLYIPPRYLLTLLKPIIKDELVVQCRENREGLVIKFPNGQKFLFTAKEIE